MTWLILELCSGKVIALSTVVFDSKGNFNVISWCACTSLTPPSPTSQPTKQIFTDGLIYRLTPVHRQKAKLSTRSC